MVTSSTAVNNFFFFIFPTFQQSHTDYDLSQLMLNSKIQMTFLMKGQRPIRASMQEQRTVAMCNQRKLIRKGNNFTFTTTYILCLPRTCNVYSAATYKN